MPIILDPIIPEPPPEETPGLPPPSIGGTWRVTVAPTARPVSADELRTHCRIDSGNAASDEELCLYIDAATEYAESRLSASIMPRTIEAAFEAGQVMALPRGPVIGITGIKNSDGSTVTDYRQRRVGFSLRIVPAAGMKWPVSVTYRAGYALANGTTPAVPADLRLAVRQLAATYYENRESVTDKALVPIPHTVEAFFVHKSRDVGMG